MLTCCYVESRDAKLSVLARSLSVILMFPFTSCLSSLPLQCPIVHISFTHLCLTISVACDSFLYNTCTEGQTPSLQPAGILFMLQREDTKLDSGGGGRTGQQPPAALLHKLGKIMITIWKFVIKSLAYSDNWSKCTSYLVGYRKTSLYE